MDARAALGLLVTLISMILIAHEKVAASNVVERPIHQVVRVGQDVRFSCRSDSPNDTMRWDYRPALNNQQIQLYNGHRINSNFTDRYRVSNLADTRRDLDIRSVQLSDAGTYVCFKAGENGSFAATLVVLGLEPECSISVKLSSSGYPTDDAEVSCRVNYTGDLSPSFQCTPQSPSQHISVEHVPSQSVTYRVSLNITDANNVTVTCWMHFSVTDLQTDGWEWNTTFNSLVPEYAWSAYHLKSTWQNCANSTTPECACPSSSMIIGLAGIGGGAVSLVVAAVVAGLVKWSRRERKPVGKPVRESCHFYQGLRDANRQIEPQNNRTHQTLGVSSAENDYDVVPS